MFTAITTTTVGIAIGFIGVLKITGNLNRFFLADLVVKVPEDFRRKKNPAEDYPPSKLVSEIVRTHNYIIMLHLSILARVSTAPRT